jgi:hypothetical protein
MSTNDLTATRLKLYRLGYRIIPTYGKQAMLKGWNSQAFVDMELTDRAKSTAEKRIGKWPVIYPHLPSSGVRIENGLGVAQDTVLSAIDVDVDDAAMVEKILAFIKTVAPDIHDRAPRRYGGGEHKLALFTQKADEGAENVFARLRSQKWFKPDDPDKGYRIEIFGGGPARNGNCAHHMGVYGPHSYDDDGKVKKFYRWDKNYPELAETALTDLPVLTIAQARQIIDHFDQLARDAGWVMAKRNDSDNTEVFYDITEETRFDTSVGSRQITYDELCDEYAMHDELRCSANFMPGRGTSGDTSRCAVGDNNRHGVVAVWVFGDETIHFPVQYKPREIPDQAQEPQPVQPDVPANDAEIGDKARWLLQCYGYHALTHTAVELFKPADDCQIRPVAFQQLFRAWHEERTGPRGGVSYLYATSIWDMSVHRINIEGVRMRPDMPFPLYQENGSTFKNTYLRPRHEGSGDITPWLAFMQHLLPIAEEREWFCNWLAHKHINPGVPGVAVVMVAADNNGPVYGAGRGMLGSIIKQLLGPRYVKYLDFDIFTGKSAQGVYTDWGAYATMMIVNEARDTGDSGRWTERRAVYERLKEIVDPRAIERTFTSKGKPAFQALSFTSYLIASNNKDALQIPEDDRRITALSNGGRMTPEMAEALQTWMEQPGNIAELAHWLEARDLTAFDVYTPLKTKTKAVMQRLSRTDLDDAWDEVKKQIGPTGLFTSEQVKAAVLAELGDHTVGESARQWVHRRVRAEAMRVEDYRMPRPRRHWILCWCDCDERLLSKFNAQTAQSAVEATGKKLTEGGGSGPAVILNFPPQ